MSPRPALPAVALIGATGLIGRPVQRRLEASGYEVMPLTPRTRPALDLLSPESVLAFFTDHQPDHVVITAGEAWFGPIKQMTEARVRSGLESKLLGQIRVALAAQAVLPPGGSITLTSGALAHSPIPGSAAVALVNGALDAFVRAAALDLTSGPRLNVVSPGWIAETRQRMGLPVDGALSAEAVAERYLDAVTGTAHGQILRADS